MQLEKMDAFFDRRVRDYDAHMLTEVEGCKEGYQKIAALIPAQAHDLLDLGCGTGLELAGIFEKNPELRVTGIDLSAGMLNRLKEKYAEKHIITIRASYVGYDFGAACFDAALSFETLHHLSHREKLGVYQSVYRALRPGGIYAECDYMVMEQAEEDALFAENARLRREEGIPDGAFYHFDTPCTVENQKKLLERAGFAEVRYHWREGNTTLLSARKKAE